ncbi:L-cystine transport system permease protein YecS [Clostridiales bacterium]|nr:L-cystine transport system permease protein YecS [Clostridiales bacterium]
MSAWFDKIKADFVLNFVEGNRWKLLLNGFFYTLQITFIAMIIGIIIGVVVSTIRSTYDMTKDDMRGGKKIVMSVLNTIARLYLTVIRGTPVVIQLLIIYFVIFASSDNGVMVAALAFGINSGAYVAEIIRGGIMSIDRGQMEAGRSLGFNYLETMRYIIIPQAFKNVLPSLANEFIALLKETSVSGYVTVTDLTRAGNIIRGKTFSPFMPLVAVALVYLLMVIVLTHFVGVLERRLRNSER